MNEEKKGWEFMWVLNLRWWGQGGEREGKKVKADWGEFETVNKSLKRI